MSSDIVFSFMSFIIPLELDESNKFINDDKKNQDRENGISINLHNTY